MERTAALLTLGSLVLGAMSQPVNTVAPQPVNTTALPTPPPDAGPDLDGYAAVMLLGCAAFIMILFYMANAHVKSVHDHTWSMLNAGVSIFVAVSWNNVINFIINSLFNMPNDSDPAKGPPTTGLVVSAVLQVIFYWAFVTTLLFCFRSSMLRLKGYGTVGGHIMGFASIHLWGHICALEPFRNSAWWIFPVVALMYIVTNIIIFGSFHVLGGVISKKLSKADADRWADQAADTGNDFFCLGLAFIMVTWIKYLVSGSLDPAMADPETPKEQSQIVWTGVLSCVLLVMSAALGLIGHCAKGGKILDALTTVTSVMAAMLVLDNWSWRIMPTWPQEELMPHLAIAFQLSMAALTIVLIFGLFDHCGPGFFRRALRGIFTGMGLAVGSSWEKTFDAAVDALDQFGLNEARKCLITLLLVCIVFPAWMCYILPKADDELSKEIKTSPPLWAVLCDHNPCDKDETDESYEEVDGDA